MRQINGLHFSKFVEIDRYIKSLPSPKPGQARVFRGQNMNYGVMRPEGLRKRINYQEIWHWCASELALDMLRSSGVSGEVSGKIRELWSLFYFAMSQHYGAGTNFLDVTRSLEVALWFALHARFRDPRVDINMFGKYTPFPLFRKDMWTRYIPWQEVPGWLYIFDVPECDQRASIE